MRTELLKRREEDEAERRERRPRTPPRTAAIWVAFITLATVLFVAAFLMSQMADFGARSRQAEPRAALLHVYQLQQVHAGMTGAYGRTFREIGFSPPARSRYTYFMFDDVLRASAEGAAIPTSAALPPVLFKRFYKPAEGGFLAVAAGNIDGDPDLDIWVIDEKNQVENSVKDLDD
ncbi:MAG: hypothetical protein HY897_20480 [Deltaproteobacteria bacterium]|nr:hypothetical protein [Deltaproteobacteria bacterium]